MYICCTLHFNMSSCIFLDTCCCITGISKKLEAEAKKKGGKDIRPWIKSIVNHVYWISSSCGLDGELKTAKWLAIVNHIANKHEGHSAIYPKCEHDEILQDRQWLKEGKISFVCNHFLFIQMRWNLIHQFTNMYSFKKI